jgi:hypothetical protein
MLAAMLRGPAYPPDLAKYVIEHWPVGRKLDLSLELLCEVLSVCFQASLTAEESRPTRFRLLLTPPEKLPESGAPNEGVLRLQLDQTRPFTADELRRLSPATPFETSLIAAHLEDDKLRIWGVTHSGPAWLAPTWGGRSLVPNWTVDPIVHVTAPGHIAVRCAGRLVGGLERGVLLDAAMDVFESSWLHDMFSREREEVQRAHSALQEKAQFPTAVEQSLVGRVSQHMLRRAIQIIRGARHGGMILVVDDESDEGIVPVPRSVHLKYRFFGDEPTRRFGSLLIRLLDELAAGTEKSSVGWDDFEADRSQKLEKLEQAIFEFSRVIGSLASIDGAVVLNKRFELIGFGAEVSAESPSPTRVYRALDIEAEEKQVDQVVSVGTRHRAAYRFVQDHPRGLAIVISQDGAVRFVANRDGQVLFWEQSVSP